MRAAAVLAAVAACAAGADGLARARAPQPGSGPTAALWRPAPAYAGLFAPAAHAAAYQFFTNPRGIDEVLGDIVQEQASVRTPGGWTARALLPFDAFGLSGGYDRWTLLRLYGPLRARVARGPRQDGGVIVESWTLISPYPDVALTRLEPGTLLMVLRLP